MLSYSLQGRPINIRGHTFCCICNIYYYLFNYLMLVGWAAMEKGKTFHGYCSSLSCCPTNFIKTLDVKEGLMELFE